MWIVPWDPFLMKKLLKSEICGSVNSAQCALIGWKLFDKSNCAATVHAQCMNNSRNSKICPKMRGKKKKKEKKNANVDVNVKPKRGPNVKMLIGKLLTIHFQTWNLEKKWREISWVRTYFWSVVCYHSCILNSYSKFNERRHNFFLSLFSLSPFSLKFPFSSFLSLHHHHLSVPFSFSFFFFDLFCYLYMCFNIFFLSLFFLGFRSFSYV